MFDNEEDEFYELSSDIVDIWYGEDNDIVDEEFNY